MRHPVSLPAGLLGSGISYALAAAFVVANGTLMHCGGGSGGGGADDASSPPDSPIEAATDASMTLDAAQDGFTDGAGPADGSDGSAFLDASPDAADGGPLTQRGCPVDAGTTCFTVYANTSTDLYYLDLTSESLVPVGAFVAKLLDGGTDVITDIAVGPDDTIWAISHTALYRADPSTGRAIAVGPIAACGTGNVALTADAAGLLYVGDSSGELCKLDPTTTPPTVTVVGQMSGGLALAGDLAVVGTTAYATVYSLGNAGTLLDNSLATVDLTSAQTTTSATPTGFPRLVGLAYALHQGFAFTGDSSGRIVTIDPASGAATAYATLSTDAGQGVAFAGAGVNPRVSP